MEIFAAAAVALYAAHHVGDYWVQTDHQARHKGDAGRQGALSCLAHVISYLATQLLCLFLVALVLGPISGGPGQVALGLAVSGVTHYLADRREHGIMFRLARMLPGKADFLKLGVPRPAVWVAQWCDRCHAIGTCPDGEKCMDCLGRGHLPTTIDDNPSLGTGAWALDQAWHIFWGVFVAALIIAA